MWLCENISLVIESKELIFDKNRLKWIILVLLLIIESNKAVLMSNYLYNNIYLAIKIIIEISNINIFSYIESKELIFD